MHVRIDKKPGERSASGIQSLAQPLRALVVDAEPNMGRFHAKELERVDVACEVATSLSQAAVALDETEPSFDLAYVSLAFPSADLRAFFEQARAQGVSRIIGVAFENQRTGIPGLDAVVVKPTPPAVMGLVGRNEGSVHTKTPSQLVRELIAMSSLGHERNGFERVAEQLKAAVSADAVFVYQEQPRRRWSIVDDRAKDRSWAPKIEPQVRACAASGARHVVPAGVTAAPEHQPGGEAETIYAWRGEAETGLTMALVFKGCVALPRSVESMLRSLTQRLAQEAGWQLVQDRLMTELDAVRDVGGLDPLLGTWSRSLLSRLLSMMQSACARSGSALSVAVLDVVGMGEINDRFGHREGDGVLKYVAEVVVYVVRAHDVVARFDGDAVAVVFEGATVEQAKQVIERIQAALQSQAYQTEDGDELRVVTAAGLAPVPAEGDAEDPLRRAAAAADRLGGGGTVVASAPIADELPTRPPGSGPPALAGVTLGGGYRILHEIGSGGGGGVYRGEDLALRRPVAVKVLRPDLAQNESLVERFRDEAATLASLRHPHLVQIYTFGVDNGIAYFVMELVEGESLFDAIQRCRKETTRISPARAAQIVNQVAAALQTLHQSGIHHRDVKPANVLLDPFRDRAVLVDVGIASRAGEQSIMAGTPGYMAPEAATDQQVDPTADVYGLAATIYELLTLTPPWPEHDDPIVVLRRQQAGPPRPPSRFRTDIAAVDDVLVRALEPKPHHRYPDVQSFALALTEALRQLDETIPGQSPSGPDSRGGAPSTPMPLGSAPTLSWNHTNDSSQSNTRAVVFRSLPRVVGARHAIEWRVSLGRQRPHLAEALSPSAPPLGWLPSSWLVDLLQQPPSSEKRSALELGRDLGRAAVRATFRRFFPASVATLSPVTVLQALPQIWRQYHTWGEVQVGPQKAESATIFVRRAPPEPVLAAWIQGMLEQLVVMSGADEVTFGMPEKIEAGITDPWAFVGQWAWSPGSDRPWR